MANVLITGGAGYVGAVVTGAFLDAGHTVTVLDRLDDGGQGLLGYVPQTRFRFLAGDVRDRRIVADAVRGQDVLLHLAAIVGFGECNADPRHAESVNVGGTQTLLAARDPGQLVTLRLDRQRLWRRPRRPLPRGAGADAALAIRQHEARRRAADRRERQRRGLPLCDRLRHVAQHAD